MRSNYNTKQKQIIKQFLEENKDCHITAKEVQTYLDQKLQHIGLSTIYRLLNKMVEDGILRKYIIDNSSSACFEYVNHKDCCNMHFHLKCEVCDQLTHIDCDNLLKMTKHLMKHHYFSVNLYKTVFYGTCEKCLKKE